MKEDLVKNLIFNYLGARRKIVNNIQKFFEPSRALADINGELSGENPNLVRTFREGSI